ncbi:ABC transporter permease [Actinoplanes lobatus]|uniref:ABC transporter permease n=1 Tax=Actinoplanes lobatus TaxID=113568 RepID=A0A7W7MJU2_9ACTN|nr:ABC transporter permease [Actinoplanes lobatus]MBB4752415.1 peptide/nickel transport system permease protein [Actinoplanes lobatus]GGN95121.1 ABC transporter permease [Actinoplanes lobatus]GIE46125.1 ABC transporter permease [Actinoplanes lobatus]
MGRYLIRRLGQALLVLWAAYSLSFVLLSALPGDAISNRIASPDSGLTGESGAVLLRYYGLDQPLWEQYLRGIGRALQGDLGLSLHTAQPVRDLLADTLPSTLALTGLALVVGILLAAVIALAINYLPSARARGLFSGVPSLFASVPTFVVGVLALQYLSFKAGLIPSVDDGSLSALLAPAVTLGLVIAAPLAQVFAASIRTTRAQPFVHVLHAKGAGEGYIFGKDVLRNSSLPVLTLLGLACGELIAGSVVTESVFARDGVGNLVVGAVNTQDLPVVQGVVLLSTVTYVLVNLAVDVAFPFIDPRVLVGATS